MEDRRLAAIEIRLDKVAAEFRYPPHPDMTREVMARIDRLPANQMRRVRRLAWSLVVLAAIAAGLLAVPPVRAQILEFLQVGVVKIFQVRPDEQLSPTQNSVRTVPSAALIPSLESIAGETDLGNAQERVDFPIRLPGYPPDLGQPDRVFLQDMAGPLVVLVWVDPQEPEQVRLSLHIVGPGSYAIAKFMPPTVETVKVNGQTAVWAEGPYLLHLKNGNTENFRLIQGHVLIWEQGELTFRLETDLPLEEAIQIAESLR